MTKSQAAAIEKAKQAYATAAALDIPNNDEVAENEAINALPAAMDSDLAVAIGRLLSNSGGDPKDSAVRALFAAHRRSAVAR